MVRRVHPAIDEVRGDIIRRLVAFAGFERDAGVRQCDVLGTAEVASTADVHATVVAGVGVTVGEPFALGTLVGDVLAIGHVVGVAPSDGDQITVVRERIEVVRTPDIVHRAVGEYLDGCSVYVKSHTRVSNWGLITVPGGSWPPTATVGSNGHSSMT